MFYAECDGLPSAAAIKWCLLPNTLQADAAAATRQFDAFQRVGDAMRNGVCHGVPRTYLLERDCALFAVEWIDGQTMTESVHSWRCSAGAARSLLARAGDWLRHFHGANRLGEGTLDIEEKLRYLCEYDDCALIRHVVFAEGVAELRRSARDAALVRLERSWIHGDFKTDNLIVSGERIVGIDVDIRHENAVVYDLAPFINHIDLELYHPALLRLAWDRTRFISAFVDAYCADRSCDIWLPLSWVRLYLMLAAWRTAHDRDGPWMRTSMVEFVFRRATSRLISEISRLR